MVRCRSKNGHKKRSAFKRTFGLRVRKLFTILGSIVNVSWGWEGGELVWLFMDPISGF